MENLKPAERLILHSMLGAYQTETGGHAAPQQLWTTWIDKAKEITGLRKHYEQHQAIMKFVGEEIRRSGLGAATLPSRSSRSGTGQTGKDNTRRRPEGEGSRQSGQYLLPGEAHSRASSRSDNRTARPDTGRHNVPAERDRNPNARPRQSTDGDTGPGPGDAENTEKSGRVADWVDEQKRNNVWLNLGLFGTKDDSKK